jgi:hypothetical protein
MLKFVKVAGGTNSLKLKAEDNQENWFGCSPDAKSFASKNLVAGDDVEAVFETKENVKTIVKIGKPGTLGTAVQAPPAQDKSQAQPPEQKTTSTGTRELSQPNKYRDPMTPAEARMVRRQSVMGYACEVSQSVVCQLPITSAEEVSKYVITVFNNLLNEVEKGN